MDSIANIFQNRPLPEKRNHREHKTWLLAERIAKATRTKPNRWLKDAKAHAWACERALIDLKELEAKNPAAYFTWLLRKHKG